MAQFMQEAVQNKLITIIYVTKNVDFDYEKKQRHYHSFLKNQHLINSNTALLPFLTIEENFFVGVKQNSLTDFARELKSWQELFKLGPQINQKYPSELTTETHVIIQLIRAFVLKKRHLILDDVSLNLSPSFLANMIPVLKKIVRERQVSLIILTHKKDLALDHHLTCYPYPPQG